MKIKKMAAVTLSVILALGACITGTAFAEPALGQAKQEGMILPLEGKDYMKHRDVTWIGGKFFSEEGMQIAQGIANAEEGNANVLAVSDATVMGSYAGQADQLTEGEKTLLMVELTDQDLLQEYTLGQVYYEEELTGRTDSLLGTLDYVFQKASELNMPAILVTEPSPEAENYKELLRGAKQLQEKWGFGIIDLNAEEFSEGPDGQHILQAMGDYLIDIKGDAASMRLYAGNLPKYSVDNVKKLRDSALEGMTIIQLGSSVTAGMGGVSFAEYIAKRSGGTLVKEAALGTSLSNYGKGADRSYINRMRENIDPEIDADLFMCQLSTNDFKRGTPLGEVSEYTELGDFDVETLAGGIEYILTYAKQTWDCPIMFYTCADFDDPEYEAAIDLLYELQNKYEFGIIDLYHNLYTDIPQYRVYMIDGIHPTSRGYLEWWTPYMETCIAQYLQPDKASFNMTDFRTIETADVLEEPMTFDMLPEGFNNYIAAHRGQDLLLHYTTDAYDDGVTYTKFCRVYLPYGYDPDDTETKYNVMYFQHGNGNSPNTLFDVAYNSDKNTPANAMYMLNNLMDPDNDLLDRFIIICPTYYFETPEDAKMTNDSQGPAGDGRYEGIAGNYYREVVEDLIPQIESRFNVYCEDFSPEGIKASRDHRAFAGYSRGSVCTWYMFHHDLEYFKWWMPMSAGIMPDNMPLGTEASEEDDYQYLKEAIDAHPELDYYILAASGGPEDAAGMRTLLRYLTDQKDVFSYGKDPSVNNIYYTCSDLSHNMLYMPYYLYEARDIIFHND